MQFPERMGAHFIFKFAPKCSSISAELHAYVHFKPPLFNHNWQLLLRELSNHIGQFSQNSRNFWNWAWFFDQNKN